MSIPPDFEEIPDDRYELFYKVNNVGEVVITGDKQRCVLSCELSDGSRLQGGLTEGGEAFGVRITKDGKQYPIRWQETFSSVGTTFQKSAQVASDIEELEEQARQAKAMFSPDEPLKKSLSKVQGVIDEPAEASSGLRTGLTLETLEEIGRTIEDTIAQVHRVQGEISDVKAENDRLREEVAKVKADAKAKLEETAAAYAKKVQMTRWLVQEVRSDEFTVQGLENKSWEFEDPSGSARYLVVVSSPPGADIMARSLMKEVEGHVTKMVGEGKSIMVHARNGSSVTVYQLTPGVEVSAGTDQF